MLCLAAEASNIADPGAILTVLWQLLFAITVRSNAEIVFGMLFEYYFIYLQNQIAVMTKNYFYILLLMIGLFSAGVSAQESKQPPATIEGLNFYPNPVSNGKIYITTRSTTEKEIVIFDVLGKKVLQVTTTAREINVSNLSPGVYFIKITEGEATATRKLIVK